MTPVSDFLEAELRAIVLRKGIVAWLDLDAAYTAFADALCRRAAQGGVPYAVHAFRGSHLELLLRLEGIEDGAEMSPLVLHLPGWKEDTLAKTPLLELYAPGVRYRRKLDTLVTDAAAGRVPPERIQAFVSSGVGSLEAADAWLRQELDTTSGGGQDAYLAALSLPGLLDDLLLGGFLAGRLRHADAEAIRESVWARISALAGVPASWREGLPDGAPDDLAAAAAGWALGVEYVDDLKRPPVDARLRPATALPRAVVANCAELARHLRDRHPVAYGRIADETEARLAEEAEAARAEDLGRIDTFRFEEERVLDAALDALAEEHWPLVLGWWHARSEHTSYWLRNDAPRRATWQLLRDAAVLGAAIEAAGAKLAARDLPEALQRYQQAGAAVDQAHRHLEQRRVALLVPNLPHFEALRLRLDALRAHWSEWADWWARDFNALCRGVGFLPTANLQQRTLFEEVVHPSTQESGTTAYFVVDALRFEMGEELYRALKDTPATNVHLAARLAELPTVTEVGMNVLAPVARGGRLAPAVQEGRIRGFHAGEFRVSTPDTRVRAMHARVGGNTAPLWTLQEVVARDAASLRSGITRARLVVIHSDEIDSAGESGVGPSAFDHVLQQLRTAWTLLREAGVRRFVFTADHGFLLLYDARKAQPRGRKIDPKRRHTLTPLASDHPNEARVSLAALGYDGTEEHLVVPEGIDVFDTGDRSSTFVHGGNSLQERVIPVLTVVHRSPLGADTVLHEIFATAADPVAGMHRVSGCVRVVSQAKLAFGGAQELELALRVPDDERVRVELCDASRGARVVNGALRATVGAEFEVFFRLLGPVEAKVRIEVHQPGGTADACSPEERFTVSPQGRREPSAPPVRNDRGWLSNIEDEGVRQLFAHLDAHGTVTEVEAAGMLGGPRGLRRFSSAFEQFVARAPFGVRIETVAGVKRYVREGGS
jgi:hypothetical protein